MTDKLDFVMALAGRLSNGYIPFFATENKKLWLTVKLQGGLQFCLVVLGPLLFSLYINDVSIDIDSEIRLFADDCVCYHEIREADYSLKLQRDIDRLGCWARKWGM